MSFCPLIGCTQVDIAVIIVEMKMVLEIMMEILQLFVVMWVIPFFPARIGEILDLKFLSLLLELLELIKKFFGSCIFFLVYFDVIFVVLFSLNQAKWACLLSCAL